MLNPQAVIFIGIQAAGKSTFYAQRFADTHVRINLDMLRTRIRERILFEACLAAKQSLVIDNTNVTAADRRRYIGPSKTARFRVIGYYFATTLGDALERNRRRALDRPIPARALAGTLRRLEPPAFDEGFDELYRVTIGATGEFIVRKHPNAPR